MASIAELVELSNQGDLGAMLEETFHGKRGALRPRKDAEFMIGFGSREETPSARAIGEAVIRHYTRLGYEVEPDRDLNANSFNAKISYGPAEWVFLYVIITTYYPLTVGDEHNHVRITTSLFD